MATFKVFSRRWGHDDTYRIKRTRQGWLVEHMSINGDCDKEGKPVLYENFSQDSINWPSGLPSAMETLWDYAEKHNLTDDQLQDHLDQLANWVSTCERSQPGGIFNM